MLSLDLVDIRRRVGNRGHVHGRAQVYLGRKRSGRKGDFVEALEDRLFLSGAVTAGSGPNHFVAGTSTAYFFASDGVSNSLWKTDGSSNGTSMVKEVPSAAVDTSVAAGDALYFTLNNGTELWRSDGTGPGTARIAQHSPVRSSFLGGSIAAFDAGVIYSTGDALYQVDGSTHAVTTLSTFTSTQTAAELISAADLVFFIVYDQSINDTGQSADYTVWRTDGTVSGTFQIPECRLGRHCAVDGRGGREAVHRRGFISRRQRWNG